MGKNLDDFLNTWNTSVVVMNFLKLYLQRFEFLSVTVTLSSKYVIFIHYRGLGLLMVKMSFVISEHC